MLTDVTVVSTKKVPVLWVDGQAVFGKSCAHLLFGVIPLTETYSPSLKVAIEHALDRGNGQVLLDAMIYQKQLLIPLLFHRQCYTVEGKAVRLRNSR